MFVLLLLVLTSVDWTHQHLTYPINYCTLAAACVHDNRMVCASTPDGCSRRSFLDQCDMYEYNCDFSTPFESAPCEEDVIMVTEMDAEFVKQTVRNLPSPVFLDENLDELDDYKLVANLETTKPFEKDSLASLSCNDDGCGRPHTWHTTVKGETRDFFRILQKQSN